MKFLLSCCLISCTSISFSQNVGIDVPTPTEKLEVAGNINASSGVTNAMMGLHPTYPSYTTWWKKGNDFTLATDGTNSLLRSPSPAGNIILQSGSNDRLTINGNTGNIGIGTSPGTEKFEIAGNLRLVGSNAMMGYHPSYNNTYAAWWKQGFDYTILTEGINSFLNAPSATGNIYLTTGNVSKLTVNGSTGNVGIGVNTTNSSLEVARANFANIRINSTGGIGTGLDFINSTSRSWRIYSIGQYFSIFTSNNLLTSTIGTVDIDGLNNTFEPYSDNIYNLGNSGYRWKAVYSTTGVIQTSDMRLKKNIRTINYGVETLMKLNPVSYQWKDGGNDGRTSLGFLAQDVQKIIPEAVYQNFSAPNENKKDARANLSDPYGMNYSDLIPVLVKSIQEQQVVIQELRNEIEKLKNK